MSKMLSETALTEFAQIIEETKPHLLAIEDEVQRVQHGEVTVRLEVRNGQVEKMQFIDPKRNWLRDKVQKDIMVSRTIVAEFVRSVEPLT